ncbi:hypothetical protein [Methyloceanibacter sp.]|uniref:DUF6980 family protein n=1 Tax=Methyloceanibacter sp. TaxID=1965321 RepID=UPI002B52B873|nr:hypothetical protein [Methyloceanibacter sp.]HML92185.1 hypothetical protein [Methyloceanibacter sp.]
MTEFWLSDDEMDEQIEANRLACQRLDDFDRDDDDWDEIWDGVFAILAEHLGEVREAFDLDPRKSALFENYPDLLWAACDPQQPVIYSPVFREFGMPVFDGGPAMTTMRFDPWTGKELPSSVRDAFFEEAEKILGHEVGVLDDELDTLPGAYQGETWWVEKGL